MYSFNACHDEFSLKFSCGSPMFSSKYCLHVCLHNRLPRTACTYVQIKLSRGQTHNPSDMLSWTYSIKLCQKLGRLLDVHHTLVIHKLQQQNLHSVEINFVTYSILLLIGRKVHVHGNCLWQGPNSVLK